MRLIYLISFMALLFLTGCQHSPELPVPDGFVAPAEGPSSGLTPLSPPQ